MKYIENKADYDQVESTEAQIKHFLGGDSAGGTVSWHIPHDVHKIPNSIVQTYSPPIGASILLEAVKKQNGGGWVGMFTKFARWDRGAEASLKKLELKFDEVTNSLVAFDLPVSEDLVLKEYRVHWTHLKGRLRDVMIWEESSGVQLATTYVWCGKYMDEE